MGRVTIERLARVSSIDWALRFTGQRADFVALVEELKADEDAYWDTEMFDGRGGWVIAESALLLGYKERFFNLEQRMRVAQERSQAG